MPTTRAQSTAVSQSGQQQTSDDEFDSETELSGLEYDTRQLTPRSKQRFDDAHEGHFEVAQCGERTEDGLGGAGSYYVFEVAETTRYSIRIQEPGQKFGHLPCSPCNQDPGVCRHVFWLTDQIARHTLSDAEKENNLTLTNLGYPSRVPDPYQQISSIGIEKLAEEANWQITRMFEEDHDLNRRRRAAEIREIMAALSPFDVASDYRPDIFDELQEKETFEQSLVDRDLEATLARILMTKNDMFSYFRRLISTNHCASDFFLKMKQKAERTFEEMDHYFAVGASSDLAEPHDVAWCADQLTKIVASIRNQLENLTLRRDSKDKAAQALIYILGEVTNRDKNSYAGPVWQHSPQRRLPERERNLYHRLINAPDRTTGSSFILSDLDPIDASAAHFSVTELEEIFDDMTAAPTAYKKKFRELINRWKSVAGPSGQKRPGEAAGSSPKRMK